MFCEQCGNKLEEGVHFCERCGCKVSEVQKEEVSTEETFFEKKMR